MQIKFLCILEQEKGTNLRYVRCYVGLLLFLSWLLFVSKCSELPVNFSGDENKCLISSAFIPLVSGTKQYMNNVPKNWSIIFSLIDFYSKIAVIWKGAVVEKYFTCTTNSSKEKISSWRSNVSFNIWLVFCHKECTKPIEAKCYWWGYCFCFWREKFRIQSPGKWSNTLVDYSIKFMY